jgi:hypothetical protein
MKIFFGGIQLTDWSDYPAFDVSVNGQSVVEAIDIVRAAAKRFFSRGNKAITLEFSVRREFATHHEAQKYLLTHFTTLPDFGLCQVTCGVPGEEADFEDVFLENAVLSATPQGTFSGVEVIVRYSIQAGTVTTDAPPEFLIAPGGTMIKLGKQAIASGVDTVAVVFTAAFPGGTTVVVTANVAKPSGSGSNIFATVRDDLVTVNGFTAELSGPTPDANHKLNWTAAGV